MRQQQAIDPRGGRAVSGGVTARAANPASLSAAQSRAIGALSAQLQADLGIVQMPLDRIPMRASKEWWRWPALGG